MFACRVRMLHRLLVDVAWLTHAVPPSLRWLGSLGVALVRAGLRGKLGKYPHIDDIDISRRVLEKARAQQKGRTRGYLLGQFTFAGASPVCLLRQARLLQGSVC
jgi:hypothetical protein